MRVTFTPREAPASSDSASASTTSGGPSLMDLAKAVAGQFPPRFGLLLRFEDTRLRLRSNSEALVEDLRAYFGPLASDDAGLVPPSPGGEHLFLLLEAPAARPPLPLAPRPAPPGKTPDKERFADISGGRVVRKQATGMLFFFGPAPAPNIAVGPCLANRNQVVNFLCARYLETRVAKGWLLAHAAGVSCPGGGKPRGLALCGFAGMGKSTLALHLVARGCDFLSNDRALIEPADLAGDGTGGGPVLHGIPKHPRLNPGTALGNPELAPYLACALPDGLRAAYSGLSTQELFALEHKFDANVDACFVPDRADPGATRMALAAPLAGVAVLNWSHGGGEMHAERVDLAQRPDLLAALRKQPGLFYLPGALKTARLEPERFAEVLAGIPALELSGGSDFSAAAKACLDLLGQN